RPRRRGELLQRLNRLGSSSLRQRDARGDHASFRFGPSGFPESIEDGARFFPTAQTNERLSTPKPTGRLGPELREEFFDFVRLSSCSEQERQRYTRAVVVRITGQRIAEAIFLRAPRLFLRAPRIGQVGFGNALAPRLRRL